MKQKIPFLPEVTFVGVFYHSSRIIHRASDSTSPPWQGRPRRSHGPLAPGSTSESTRLGVHETPLGTVSLSGGATVPGSLAVGFDEVTLGTRSVVSIACLALLKRGGQYQSSEVPLRG